MATGTVMPSPVFTGFDNNGDPLSGGKLYTYAAGTTTPLATYTDVGLLTPNANPIILDSGGRATVFLRSTSYKFVLKTSADVTVWTQDNVSAVPNTQVDLDVTATAGEALTAGDAAYISAGDGGRSVGRWYKTDADNTYASSTAGMVGMVPTDIASGDSGSVRLSGRLTGLSGLTIGAPYYASATAGLITTVAPTNARFIGVADSLTSVVLAPNQAYGNASLQIAGTLPAARLPAGTIIQTVNATYATETASSSNVYADTGLTASITPAGTSHKVLVTVMVAGLRKTAATYVGLKLQRGGSDIAVMEAQAGFTSSAAENNVGAAALTFLDSPASVASLTYKVVFASVQNIAQVNVQMGSARSSITLQEVMA